MVRVRIAPSPTGIPHLGNTRTALFNFLFARHHKGTFILRIEDTDRARLIPEAEEAIYQILEWLGLFWDEEYVQSKRLALYKEASQNLLERGFVRKEDGAVRFIVPEEKLLEWTDSVGNKKISFKSDDIENFIILKSDGFPTYHLANVVDDHLMRISHVIRGDEWISSTPKHLLLYEAFGWNPPVFAHLPVILGPDKSKLSKRHGAKSVLEYRDEGYLPEALNNFMALLGWNPGGDRELMTLEEMTKLFDLRDINTNSPIFDVKKLSWFNSYYIRKSQISGLKSQILAQNAKLKETNSELLDRLIPLAQTRMKTLNDFYALVRPFFEESRINLTQKEKEIAKKLREQLGLIKQWTKKRILEAIKKVLESEKVKMPLIYKIVTGKASGLPLPETLEILGKEKVLEKLKNLTQ